MDIAFGRRSVVASSWSDGGLGSTETAHESASGAAGAESPEIAPAAEKYTTLVRLGICAKGKLSPMSFLCRTSSR